MKSNCFSCSFLTDFKYKEAKSMYKSINKLQHSLNDFNQLMGLHMNLDSARSNWLTEPHGVSLK